MPQLKSYAKLNLGLKVHAPDASGMHPIESVFQEISLADTISITNQTTNANSAASGTCSLTFSNPTIDATQNTIIKAWTLYEPKLSATIHVEKNIPLGAGLGGGSSNAAAILSWLNKKEPKYSKKALADIAFSIGADVPFFLEGGRAKVTGYGEHIVKERTKRASFVIIYPNIHCDTKIVYNTYDKLGRFDAGRPNSLYNDLKTPAFHHYPELASIEKMIRTLIPNPVFMSGSGSTLYIMDPSSEKCLQLEAKLKALYPDFLIKHVEAIG